MRFCINNVRFHPIGGVDGQLVLSMPIARGLSRLQAIADEKFTVMFDAARQLMASRAPTEKRAAQVIMLRL